MTVSEFFKARHADLELGVLRLLAEQNQQTAGALAKQLSAGMRELDRVLQDLRLRGRIRSRRRRWELVP